MVQSWQEIDQGDTDSIRAAYALLKDTIGAYDLTETNLNNKMQKPKHDPNDPNADTAHHCLRLWSYGDPVLPQIHPLVSAFFFLRRRRSKGNADAAGLWANCLTVGAKDTSAGGLTKDQLLDELNVVCGYMKDLDEGMKLEVMHLQTLKIKPQNLKDVFDQMHKNAQPPKTKPRFEDQGKIKLGYPWVPYDNAGNQVFMDFVWLLIVPKR
jgi:hypothetical protein